MIYIYILATWIFIAHFEYIVNINISSLSAAKSAYGSNGQATVRGIIQSSTWHVGVVLFQCFMHRLFPFPRQYQSYTALCICAWVRLCIFSVPFSFSCLLYVFSPPFFLSFLPLVFLPVFPLLNLSPLLFIHLVFSYSLPLTSPYLLLLFPLYTCFYITALQAGRSRVRFLMVSLEFFTDIILLAALWPWGWLSH
jgi:hypothetical protein